MGAIDFYGVYDFDWAVVTECVGRNQLECMASTIRMDKWIMVLFAFGYRICYDLDCKSLHRATGRNGWNPLLVDLSLLVEYFASNLWFEYTAICVAYVKCRHVNRYDCCEHDE